MACRATPLPAKVSTEAEATKPPETSPAHAWDFNNPAELEILEVRGTAYGRIGEAAVQVYGQGCNEGALQLLGGGGSAVDFGDRLERIGRDNFTLSLWFSTRQSGSIRELFSNRTDSSHGNFFNVRINVYGEVMAELDENNQGLHYALVKSRGGLADGQWHHVAVLRKENQVTLFLDGERASDSNSGEATDLSGGGSFQIGSSDIAGAHHTYFSGFIDDVKFFHTALGAPEIQALYTRHLGELGPCKWHPIRDAEGSPVAPPTLKR